MNEPQFGNKIRQVLNEGAHLDQASLNRLRAARERALRRQRVRQLVERRVPGLAWAGELIGSFGGFTGFSFRLILPIVVLVGGLVAIRGWQQNLRVAEVVEIDALLLTDELPLDAFLDKGFEAWLKKQKRSPL